jgi:mxaA protein
MCRIAPAAFVLLGAVAGPLHAQSTVRELAVTTPRSFGFVIGDRIVHDVVLELRARFDLDPDSLPRKGRLTRWLTLNDVVLRRERRGRAMRYEIKLVYQVVNATQAVLGAATPLQSLRVLGPDGDFPVVVPAWGFTIGPIVGAEERPPGTLPQLQPAELPPPIPTAARRARLVILAAIAAMLFGAIGVQYLWSAIGRRGGGHFALACGRIEQRMKADEPGAYARALADLHGAFNATAGRAVFEHDLARFFAGHPRFEPLRPAIEALFAESRRVFYAAETSWEPTSLGPLRDLCRACRDVERGR